VGSITMSSSKSTNNSKLLDIMKISTPVNIVGYVDWELIDDETGKVVERGRGYSNKWWEPLLYFVNKFTFISNLFYRFFRPGQSNAILDKARSELADFMVGTSITVPGFVGIATGSGTIASSDTTLDTPVDYDGSNEAKAFSGKSVRGNNLVRYVTQFTKVEAIQTIGQLGLFTAANSGNLWAKVSVTIVKTATQRLNVYWYVIFERNAALAIKSGGSIGATGLVSTSADSTLTFPTTVTSLSIHNNSGVLMYVSLNDAMTGNPPEDYDFLILDGGKLELMQEEVSIATVHVFMADTFTLPDTQLVVRGW